jgi:hypothetical protein
VFNTNTKYFYIYIEFFYHVQNKIIIIIIIIIIISIIYKKKITSRKPCNMEGVQTSD